MTRKISVITGTRAEYGILLTLLKRLQSSSDVELQIIVTGMHLEEKFGNTYKIIENDGFEICHKIPMCLTKSDSLNIAQSVGKATSDFAVVLNKTNPDLIVVLGDRFEIFSAAQAAMLLRIPIAHIHGGELTEGLIDEAIRHSVTKMSQFHYTSCELYRKRVIQLGETPENVFNYGAPGLDYIKDMTFLSKEDLGKDLGMELQDTILLVTYHPVSLDLNESLTGVRNLVKVLKDLKDASIIITMPNADPGADEVIKEIESIKDNPNVLVTTNLGQVRYLSLLKVSSCVVGNSSSGIIEAPFSKVPTLNIGTRQKGREQSDTVIQTDITEDSIRNGLQKAISKDFMEKCSNTPQLFGDGNASEKIYNSLLSIKLENSILKKFNDVNFNY